MEIIKGLSEGQIEEIKRAAEDIMENVGFQVHHKEILHRCQKAEDLISKFKSPLPEKVQEEIRRYFRNGKI